MNLRSIKYFLITAEELNVTRAAERLYISQQALSSHIKRLEEEYQVQLFERRPSFHLTPEGEQMLFYGKQILESEAKLRAAFSDIKAECRGTSSSDIAVSSSPSSQIFPPSIFAGGSGRMRRIAFAIVVFPAPVSPTNASVSPFFNPKDTWLTACTVFFPQ